MKAQRPLLRDFLENREGWVLWLDGGRSDVLSSIYGEYFEGELTPVYNGGVGFTADWAEAMLSGDYPDHVFINPSPIWSFEDDSVTYDEREHFGEVPDPSEFSDISVEDRLSALGYVEGDSVWEGRLSSVEPVVSEYAEEYNRGIIRLTSPHPPLDGLPITSGRGKLQRVEDAIRRGEITQEELWDAYVRTYHKTLSFVDDILEYLNGEIVITSDHGECLFDGDCEQVFHSRYYDKHDHLTNVPWFELEQ